jgi:3-phosphoshikimate 1-carboxyvinyltransferase
MFRILSDKARDKSVNLPSSKSVTHRILVLAALNDGETEILNPLYSEDTKITMEALRSFGAEIIEERDTVRVLSSVGKAQNQKVFLGNSGSSARFLIPLVLHLDREIYFYGTEELHKRPFAELFDILRSLGFKIDAENNSLPATVFPPENTERNVVNIGELPSSQIVSGLMMSYAKTREGLRLIFEKQLPSFPYVDMTRKLMARLDLRTELHGNKIEIHPHEKINYDWRFSCEKDLSAASYWVAYALINNVKVNLENLLLPSLQGDEKIFEIAETLGASVKLFSNRVEISGTIKRGLEYDCEDIPDIVPTLPVMGMFAPDKFVLKNVSRLRYKESDRINAIKVNIETLGGKCEYREPNLIIYPQEKYHGGGIKTFDDHRIAMCFAIAGTRIEDVAIDNPACVEKSYPSFWNDFTEFKNVEE